MKITSQGFTLIEIVTVIGMLAIIGSLTLFVDLNSYRDYVFRGEREQAVDALRRARSEAVNNVCIGSGCTDGVAHGVHFQSGEYVIFQGTAYSASAPANEVLSQSGVVTLSGTTDVVFTQLSGNTSFNPSATSGSITLKDSYNHNSTITINAAGEITFN